ncbi:GNAT family N-acetyltransferase [Marivirga tractuosa]|uniref:GNAT family N-acetyltransferase n=1 Tax=Marivirga tractuosa TaxID=1006 RepID=UPI0035D06F84
METEIQIIQANRIDDLLALISVFEDVFEMEKFVVPSQTHLQKLLNNEHFLAVVAKSNEKVIAGLTVYVLDQYYSERPIAHIYDLAVSTSYQRKGIGSKLIAFANEYCKQSGFEEVFVQAEKDDDYAIDFYRSTKPAEELEAVHFSYKFT